MLRSCHRRLIDTGPSETCSGDAAKAYASGGVFILKAEPVADDAAGVLQGLKAMAMDAGEDEAVVRAKVKGLRHSTRGSIPSD
jgi:hypothetical protein